MTVFEAVVATFKILGGEQEVGGQTSLLIATHQVVPLPAVPFSVSDLYTNSRFPVLHFSALQRILHLFVSFFT